MVRHVARVGVRVGACFSLASMKGGEWACGRI